MRGQVRICSMPMDEYRLAPGISKSGLDDLHRSPAHYRESILHPKPSTPAQEFGSMLHCYVLEPDIFEQQYAVLPAGLDRRTKEGKEAYAEILTANEGKSFITKESLQAAHDILDALRAHSRASLAITDGEAERSAFFWREPTSAGPVECKARFDYITQGLIIDLKTATDARIEAFSRSAWNYRYHVQAAWYKDAYRDTFGKEDQDFIFVVVEKEPPYGVGVFRPDDEMVEQGRREYQLDLNIYAECLANDVWPAYPEEVLALTLPGWAMEQNYG